MERKFVIFEVRFKNFENVTHPGHDGDVYRYVFSYVPKEKIGSPEEKAHTKCIQIDIDISRSLRSIWKVNIDGDLVKILYYFAKQNISSIIEGKINYIKLRTNNQPKVCPYDRKRVVFPPDAPFNIEIKRKIGY